VFFHFESNQIE